MMVIPSSKKNLLVGLKFMKDMMPPFLYEIRKQAEYVTDLVLLKIKLA
jgi:hypothetical protein